jgi:hypothetical protein
MSFNIIFGFAALCSSVTVDVIFGASNKELGGPCDALFRSDKNEFAPALLKEEQYSIFLSFKI